MVYVAFKIIEISETIPSSMDCSNTVPILDIVKIEPKALNTENGIKIASIATITAKSLLLFMVNPFLFVVLFCNIREEIEQVFDEFAFHGKGFDLIECHKADLFDLVGGGGACKVCFTVISEKPYV